MLLINQRSGSDVSEPEEEEEDDDDDDAMATHIFLLDDANGDAANDAWRWGFGTIDSSMMMNMAAESAAPQKKKKKKKKKKQELLEELRVVEAEVAGLEKKLRWLYSHGGRWSASPPDDDDEEEEAQWRKERRRKLGKQRSMPQELLYKEEEEEEGFPPPRRWVTKNAASSAGGGGGGIMMSSTGRASPFHRRLLHSKTLPASEHLPSSSLLAHLSDSPTSLSQKLILCMSAVYCKLSEPPLNSTSPFASPVFHGRIFRRDSALRRSGIWAVDPYQVKGNYGGMVEVPWISVDKQRLSSVTGMLRGFRSMVEELEMVDPRRLRHDEKLAFWINIYNALLMHAHLAYGIPRNHVKRMTLLQRAAYKIGGTSINAYAIQHSILRCRSHQPTQWLQNLLSSASKLKSRDDRRSSYAIDNAEPIACFALCCGGWSDPAVRVYTAENVHEELDAAKTEFLRATLGFQADKKVLLPKIFQWYAREAHMPWDSLLDWVSGCVQDTEKEASLLDCIRSRPNRKPSHCIEWQPYNFSFRYLFHPHITTRFTSHVYFHH